MHKMIKDIVKANRSFRSFRPDSPIPTETLLEFVELTRFTPSSVNLQPLKYKICTFPEECAVIAQNVKYAKALKGITLPPKGHEPSAYILIFLDKSISENLLTFRRDIGIVAQTIMLAAVEKGLGGCMIGNFNSDAICPSLGIPARYSLQLVLALGHPDEEIILEDAVDGNVLYYRDENSVHHVPKRPLDEILL